MWNSICDLMDNKTGENPTDFHWTRSSSYQVANFDLNILYCCLEDVIYLWTLLWRLSTQNTQQDINPINPMNQINGRRVLPETEMARTPARIPSSRFSLLASLRRNNIINKQYNKTHLSIQMMTFRGSGECYFVPGENMHA